MAWSKKNDVFALMVGHGTMTNGKWDCGCTYGKYTEADLMLNITKQAVKWLRKSGVRVLTDADKGNKKNMTATVAWANKYANDPKNHCKYYMSMHCDYKGASKGVAPLYVSSAGKKMATTIGKSVAKQMGMTWKGAFKRKDLYELNATKMTSVIFEAGSIGASKDLKYLKDYKKYGKAVAKAICKFIGVDFYVEPNSSKILKKAKTTFAEMTKLKFKYSVSGNATSWARAKKKRTSNCATYVSYVLQRMKLLKAGQVFYGSKGALHFKGKGTEKQLKKVAKITKVNASPKKAGAKKGDICTYSHPAHTQIFAGWKNGNALWYSFGGSDVGKKLPRKRGKYNTKKIDYIIRLK